MFIHKKNNKLHGKANKTKQTDSSREFSPLGHQGVCSRLPIRIPFLCCRWSRRPPAQVMYFQHLREFACAPPPALTPSPLPYLSFRTQLKAPLLHSQLASLRKVDPKLKVL